ncbi:hypothetical protein Gogos_009089 [Gossypium gossypioides]|uniref:Uncharacterized protein n=1 Tax=Gossypium gossypioides TaxID=34282 RepID=A0A7J9CDI4_GOSGO|nr:hypothetical protein [Gossypium gossypioides]
MLNSRVFGRRGRSLKSKWLVRIYS